MAQADKVLEFAVGPTGWYSNLWYGTQGFKRSILFGVELRNSTMVLIGTTDAEPFIEQRVEARSWSGKRGQGCPEGLCQCLRAGLWAGGLFTVIHTNLRSRVPNKAIRVLCLVLEPNAVNCSGRRRNCDSLVSGASRRAFQVRVPRYEVATAIDLQGIQMSACIQDWAEQPSKDGRRIGGKLGQTPNLPTPTRPKPLGKVACKLSTGSSSNHQNGTCAPYETAGVGKRRVVHGTRGDLHEMVQELDVVGDGGKRWSGASGAIVVGGKDNGNHNDILMTSSSNGLHVAERAMDVLVFMPSSMTPAPAPRHAPPSSSSVASDIVPHRPVTAFTGLTRPTTASVQNQHQSIAASVNEQRRASIQRNLHPNEPSSSTSTITTPSRRRSGPPRPFSKAAVALPALSDFASATVETSVTITVGILPKVLDMSDYNDMLDLSPKYTWKGGDDLETAQKALQRANLIFTVNVNTSGPIWEASDLGFRSHCQLHSINYVDTPCDASNSPNTTPWVLLGPRGRSSRTWVEDPKSLTRFIFTLQAIRSIPFSHTPNNLGAGPFILTAPRFRKLFGPIDSLYTPAMCLPDHVLTHQCFAHRVLHSILASLKGDPDPVCNPFCTPQAHVPPAPVRPPSTDIYMISDSDDGDVHFPEAEALIDELVRDGLPPLPIDDPSSESITRPAHLTSTEATANAIPLSRTSLFIPGPLLTSAMELASTSIKPHSFPGPGGAVDLTLLHMPGSGAYSLAAWQDYILQPHELEDHVSISARSVDKGARALIILCLWLFVGRPTGLKLKELLQEQFPSPRLTVEGATRSELALFGLRVSIGPGIGRGPRNEVVAQAVKIMLADGHYWTEREGYQTLCLHPSCTPIPARCCVLKATGLLFLLHFLFIGTPFPVSPFLFSTLFDGRKTTSKFDLNFLARFISPNTLSLIKRLEHVPLNKPLYTSQSEDCVEYQYLLNIPDIDPTMISAPQRSQDEHDGICMSVISFVTLGSVDIEHHPDYLTVGSWFNVAVDAISGQDRPHHILEVEGIWFATPYRELLLVAFDREIKAPGDVIAHLEYAQTNPENDPWSENEEVVSLIGTHINHYLTESGHLTDPDQVFHVLIDNANSTDPLLCAKLFLSVLTGSELLPINPTWKIKCLIAHDWSQEYPTIDADGRDDYGPDVSVSFCSCFKTFSITNNARLRLLLAEVPKQGQDTDFSRHIHGQLLSSRDSYTAA
ncbi:hypothetical protein DFH07DRAFT_765179 [Mycena maculata]|uniref:Uncharacterized protein n=1 Tax=Mycena maculata TaxID=230809 RepID=A0AAD7K8N4_9AGAR|nr:hypothetical protein DFH07DRAFT_765179 [Mycena maculata]